MAELLETGLVLTLIGMSVVYLLLGLLVGAIELLARFCRLFPAASPPQPTAADVALPSGGEPDDEVAGVIAAAIRMFRHTHPPSHSAPSG